MRQHYYLIRVSFLGFRYHGWAKQPNVKTIQERLERTFRFVYPNTDLKIIGSSRTDAMVSAQCAAFELFIRKEISTEEILDTVNNNLPPDIRIESAQVTDNQFNIINDSKQKEYHYFFSFGSKNHPFSAPFLANIPETLNIELMMDALSLFEGEHDFRNYCYKPKENTQTIRCIQYTSLKLNDIHTASFFPDESYVITFRGAGFMRHQIRLMVGALFLVGKGQLSVADIEKSLNGVDYDLNPHMAAPSGLILKKVDFH